MVANPAIADVELLTDQPNSRLINLYGKRFGTTSLTMWDQTNRSVSFLVRVSLDTKDLETRIRQTFPGAEIKIRQVGPQVILDGQVPDSKTMLDVLQLVTTTLMFSPGLTGGGQGGGGGMTGGASMSGGGGMGGGMAGGGMGGGGMAGGGGAAGGTMGRLVIINRVTVPGPRQILLHVKIAEINRNATRDVGVSWLYARVIRSSVRLPATTRPSARRPVLPIIKALDRTDSSRRRLAHSAVRARPRRALTHRFSAYSTLATFRYLSTLFEPIRWPKFSPSPTSRRLTDNRPASWWGACFRFPCLKARRFPAEQPL